MGSPEATMFSDSIVDKVDRIVACCDDETSETINLRPPVPETNTLHVLAVHTMGNVEEAIFEVLLGNRVNRDRDAEFAAAGSSPGEIRQKWEALRPRLMAAIESLDDAALAAEYDGHRRGRMTGRQLLLFTATHAAEHVGHAELTRDWIRSQA
jgi:uncharacterized damage-inducible protein DinB